MIIARAAHPGSKIAELKIGRAISETEALQSGSGTKTLTISEYDLMVVV
jgi:hypothetical protein